MRDLFYHPTKSEVELRRRIRVAIWAYAYECENQSLVSDAQYDAESYKIDRSIRTGHAVLDSFFCHGGNFEPYTGSWIYQHPELEGIKKCYIRLCEAGIYTPISA